MFCGRPKSQWSYTKTCIQAHRHQCDMLHIFAFLSNLPQALYDGFSSGTTIRCQWPSLQARHAPPHTSLLHPPRWQSSVSNAHVGDTRVLDGHRSGMETSAPVFFSIFLCPVYLSNSKYSLF